MTELLLSFLECPGFDDVEVDTLKFEIIHQTDADDDPYVYKAFYLFDPM